MKTTYHSKTLKIAFDIKARLEAGERITVATKFPEQYEKDFEAKIGTKIYLSPTETNNLYIAKLTK